MMRFSFTIACLCPAFLAFVVTAASGAELRSDDQPFVAQNSSTKITRAEFEAELQRIPAEMRAEFLASNKRVGDLLLQMLLRKTLAGQAKNEKLDANPVNAARVSNEADRVLAQLRVAEVEEAASAAVEAASEFLSRLNSGYLARGKIEIPCSALVLLAT